MGGDVMCGATQTLLASIVLGIPCGVGLLDLYLKMRARKSLWNDSR